MAMVAIRADLMTSAEYQALDRGLHSAIGVFSA